MDMLDDELAAWTERLICHHARRLARWRGNAAEDAEDFAQELTLAVWRSVTAQTPAVITRAWLTTVVTRTAGMIERRRRAKKRAAEHSLRALGQRDDLLADATTPVEAEVDRRLDMASVLQRLLAADRQLATQLQSHSIRELAMQQGLAPSTLRRRLERLRRAFEDAGLAIYV